MKVVFDTGILIAWLDPSATNALSVPDGPARVEFLVKTLTEQKATIVIPTPALSEFLVLAATQSPSYVHQLSRSPVVRIRPFDLRAAVEAAEAHEHATRQGNKKDGATGTWQKVKVDRQIVAIAKVHSVDWLYAGDRDIKKLAVSMGVPVKLLESLPLPPATLFSHSGLPEPEPR